MRFHKPTTAFYCGVDLHASSLYLCVIDRQGNILLHRKIGTDEEYFLKVLEPWIHDITVVVESTFNWYWLGDLCHAEGIVFVLAHALYLKAIHGAKTKNDRVDSETLARVALGGNLPVAYAYPRDHRAVRDLLRRRNHFVQMRAELLGHIHCLNMQQNNPPLGHAARKKTTRSSVPAYFLDDDVRSTAEADLAVITHFDGVIMEMERRVRNAAKGRRPREMAILSSVPGIGLITALVIAYEIDTIDRFETRQQFASYARLIKPLHESAGKKSRGPGAKIGNPHLRWAFSEAAMHAAYFNEAIGKYLSRLQRRHKKSVAMTILAHKIGRAVFHMLKRGTAFDLEKFLKN
jgi:transposase